eukprot:g18439.t1
MLGSCFLVGVRCSMRWTHVVEASARVTLGVRVGRQQRPRSTASPMALQMLWGMRTNASYDTMPQLPQTTSEGSETRPPRMPQRAPSEGWVDETNRVKPESSLPNAPLHPDIIRFSQAHQRVSATSVSSSGPTTSDFHRVFNSLSAFRGQLVANQKAMLNLLDEELDKVKRSPGMGPAALARGSTSNALDPQGAPTLMHAASGQGGTPLVRGSSGQQGSADKGEVKRYSFNSTFPSLPSVQKARKRRMSWIQKTVNPLVNQPDSGEASPADVNWTKEDKDKALNAAEEYQKGGMLSQLNQDLAKKNVRKRAAHELEQAAAGDVSPVRQTEGGILVRMGMHPWFERATMAMIFMNAVWSLRPQARAGGMDIEFNDADILAEANAGFIVVENLFCTFFTCELILRYSLFTRTWFALQDPWFMFDVFLLILMVFETWLVPIAHLLTSKSGNSMTGGASVLRVARVLRVLRTARMARLVRFMPELMILIKGPTRGVCGVRFFTLVLLLLFTYVFSVAFVQFSRGTALEGQFFGSMGTAIWTLILKCILTDQQFIIEADCQPPSEWGVAGAASQWREAVSTRQESWIMAIMVLFFILFGSLTVMNMLLGVLVEAIKTVSTIEREQLEADQDGDNRISEEEYRNVLRTPQAMAALTSLGVDVEAALDYGRLLFEDGEPLTFGDFMRGILTLRGSNQTTDIVDLRKFTADEFSHIHEVLNGICKFLVTGPCGAAAAPPTPQPTLGLHPRVSARSSFTSVSSWAVTEESSRMTWSCQGRSRGRSKDDSDVVTDTGFSRGVSGSGRSEVPIVCPPAAAAAATPHAPARNGSKCSGPPGLVDRYPSKASKSSMSELHRAIDCFSSFRIALETNQKHSLRLLDLEMDNSAALPLPAAAVEAGRHFVDSPPASPASPVSPVSPASPSGSPALAAPKLPQRQRRMSWITKQGTGFLDAKALQELTAEHNLSSEESSPSGDNRGTTYSSEATGRSKAKVKSDAKKNSTSGMLARLDPDLAKDAIRDRAAAEFGKKRVEIMKTEGRLLGLPNDSPLKGKLLVRGPTA